MHNRTEVGKKEKAKRHSENFMSFIPNSNERVSPKNEHKQRGRRPNGDSKTDDEVKHGFNLLSFSEYIIAQIGVKMQRILCEVYVKFTAGRFVNIDLT